MVHVIVFVRLLNVSVPGWIALNPTTFSPGPTMYVDTMLVASLVPRLLTCIKYTICCL